MLSDEQKKMLTEEVLGVCWHKTAVWTSWIPEGRKARVEGWLCPKCNDYWESPRPFTSWQDLGDLKDKIVEMGEWWDFEKYCFHQWNKTTIATGYCLPWLIDPTRFCSLVASWWKERKVRG